MIRIENYLVSNQRTISKTKSEFKKNVTPDNTEIISKIQRCLVLYRGYPTILAIVCLKKYKPTPI